MPESSITPKSNILGSRLKSLRREIGLSQEALGAQGFVSAPGWIKIENGQRQASEKLIERLTGWLVDDKYMRPAAAAKLKEELLTAKYLDARSGFLRGLATTHAKRSDALVSLLTIPPIVPRRGRPPGASYRLAAKVKSLSGLTAS